MSDQPSHPLIFDCFNCGNTNHYKNYLNEGEEKDKVKIVTKRCTICGAQNEVTIPDGYHTQRTDNVLRGSKKD